MKALSIDVNWWLGYANSPTWELVVDERPEDGELTYARRGDRLYAERDGYVRFASLGDENQPGDNSRRGYGGARFTFALDTGETVTSTNVWSSSSGAINDAGFGPCVEVDLWVGERRGVARCAAVTLDWLRGELERLRPDLEPCPGLLGGWTFYYPALRGMTTAESKALKRVEAAQASPAKVRPVPVYDDPFAEAAP